MSAPMYSSRRGITFHLAMPADKAARSIVKAIEKNKFRPVFCVDSRVLHFVKRLAPIGILKLMRLVGSRGVERV